MYFNEEEQKILIEMCNVALHFEAEILSNSNDNSEREFVVNCYKKHKEFFEDKFYKVNLKF